MALYKEINLTTVPGLVRLLQEGESINCLLKLSPEQILLRWVNYQLELAGSSRKICNFSEDIKDSKIYCKAFVTPRNVVSGYEKLNLAFVANLFNNCPAMEPPEETVCIIETREEKCYRNWMNSLGVKPRVNYLYTDLCDGIIIFQLMDIVQPGIVDWNKRVNSREKMAKTVEKFGEAKRFQMTLENCNYAVELGKKMNLVLVGIGGNDIMDGHKMLTLALVWQLMRAYTLALLS